ncbi:MAG: amidohydrolase family protein [Deltaproteobacteria bacterium]|nr:amidohydrolase family protein [Deltaproteobacteria bacterium]MBW2017331.1 amidohydrolase family protein [Deltaproteobacteria bacterium]MBW2129116.1 amidohydrolase family protein [Deltaproteobacteria bacterium]MBW2305283.1 amidohydrolase family protein [Deltaproteobacteria bacterium]
MKLDIFNHIFPKKYFERMMQVNPDYKDMGKRVRNVPVLYDLDARFRVMDQFEDYAQILSLASPPIEKLAGPDVSPDLAKAANDGLAEYVERYPDRFPGFIASLPLNNPDAALRETERAIEELKAVGVQFYTNVNGAPLDLPELKPLFGKMAEYDLPIWLHPCRGANFPDYLTEDKSRYEIWWTFGWPYETSVAMARLVFGYYFDEFPNLKIITHHMGGMIPYFEGRVGPGWDQLGSRTSDEDYSVILKKLKKPHLDYFKMFYADTALFGSMAGTICGLEFFGVDHVLFASDSPFDPEKGPGYIRETIRIVDHLPVSEEDRKKIYEGNARRLLKLE